MADETRKPYIIELLADKTKFVKELRGLDWEDIIGLKGKDLANVLTKAGSEGGDALVKEITSIDIDWDDVLNSKKFKSAITKIVGDANRQFRAGLVDKKEFAEITAFIGEMNSAMAEFGTGWDTKGAIRSLTAFAKAITPIRAELEALAEAPEKVKRTFDNVFGDKGLNITPVIDSKSIVNEAETMMAGVGRVVAAQAHQVSKTVEQAYNKATSTITTLTSSRASAYGIKTQQELQKMLNGLRKEYQNFTEDANYADSPKKAQEAYAAAAKAAKDYIDLVKWADSSAAEAQGLVRGNFVSVSDYDMQEMKAAIDAQIKYAEQQIQRYEEEVQNAFQLNLADKLTENLKSLNLKVSLPKDAELTRQINDTIKRINKKRLETIKTTIDVSKELNPKTKKERDDIDQKTVSDIEKKFGAIDKAIYDKQQSILANTREWRKNMQDAIVQGGANSIAFGFKWDPTDFDSEASNLFENLQDFFAQEDHKIALRIDEEALLNSVKNVLGDKTIAVGGGGSVDINAESIKEAIKSGIRDAIFGGASKTVQISHSSKKQPTKDEDGDTSTPKHTIDVNKTYTTYLIDTIRDIAKSATRENKNGELNQKQKDVLRFFAGKRIDLRNLGSTDEEVAKLLEDALLTTDEQGKIRGSDLVDAIKNFKARSKVQWKSIDELTRAVRILLTSFGEEAEYESSKEIDRESEKIIRDASKKARGVRGLRNIKNYYNRSSGQYNEQRLPDADNIEQILALTKDMETDGLLNEQLTILKEARAKLGNKTDEQSVREFQEVYQSVWAKIETRFDDLTNYLKTFSGELTIPGRKDTVKFNNKTRSSQNRTIGTLANLKESVVIEHAQIYTSPNDQSIGIGIKSPKTGRVSQGQERALLKGASRADFTVRNNHEDETDIRYRTYKAIDNATSSYFNRGNVLYKFGLSKNGATDDKEQEYLRQLITNSKLSEEVLAGLQAESEARRKRYDAFGQLDQVEANLSLARQKRNDANSRINYVEDQRGKLERFGLSARGTYANDVLEERKKVHANDFFSSDWYYEEVKRIRQETTEEMQEVEKKIQQKHKQWRQIVDKEKEAVIREFASESVDLEKVRSSAEEEFTKSKRYKAVTDLQKKKKDKKLQEIQTTIDNEVNKMVDEAMTYQADAIEAEAKDIAKNRGRTTASEKDYKDATDRVRANVTKAMTNRVEAQYAGDKTAVESEMRMAIENAIVQAGERAVQQAINDVVKGKDKQVGQRIYEAISAKEARFKNNPKFQGMTSSLLTDLDIAQQGVYAKRRQNLKGLSKSYYDNLISEGGTLSIPMSRNEDGTWVVTTEDVRAIVEARLESMLKGIYDKDGKKIANGAEEDKAAAQEAVDKYSAMRGSIASENGFTEEEIYNRQLAQAMILEQERQVQYQEDIDLLNKVLQDEGLTKDQQTALKAKIRELETSLQDSKLTVEALQTRRDATWTQKQNAIPTNDEKIVKNEERIASYNDSIAKSQARQTELRTKIAELTEQTGAATEEEKINLEKQQATLQLRLEDEKKTEENLRRDRERRKKNNERLREVDTTSTTTDKVADDSIFGKFVSALKEVINTSSSVGGDGVATEVTLAQILAVLTSGQVTTVNESPTYKQIAKEKEKAASVEAKVAEASWKELNALAKKTYNEEKAGDKQLPDVIKSLVDKIRDPKVDDKTKMSLQVALQKAVNDFSKNNKGAEGLEYKTNKKGYQYLPLEEIDKYLKLEEGTIKTLKLTKDQAVKQLENETSKTKETAKQVENEKKQVEQTKSNATSGLGAIAREDTLSKILEVLNAFKSDGVKTTGKAKSEEKEKTPKKTEAELIKERALKDKDAILGIAASSKIKTKYIDLVSQLESATELKDIKALAQKVSALGLNIKKESGEWDAKTTDASRVYDIKNPNAFGKRRDTVRKSMERLAQKQFNKDGKQYEFLDFDGTKLTYQLTDIRGNVEKVTMEWSELNNQVAITSDRSTSKLDGLVNKVDSFGEKFKNAIDAGYLAENDADLERFKKKVEEIKTAITDGASFDKINELRNEALRIADEVNKKANKVKRSYSGTNEMNAATRQRSNIEARGILANDDLEKVKNYNDAYSDLIAKHREFSTAGTLYDPENQKTLQKMAINVKALGKELETAQTRSEDLQQKVANSGLYNGKSIGDMSQVAQGTDLYEQMRAKLEELGATNIKIDRIHQKATGTIRHNNTTVSDLEVAYDELTGSLARYHRQERESLTGIPAFLNGFQKKFNSIMQYLSMTMSIHRIISEVRRGVQYVREIDKALTELKKVTDETEETYDKFLQTAAKTGARLGSTISAVTEATATFAKLGYSMQQASEMAEAAIVYKNVGDNIASTEDAADSIISTLKGFGLEASESMAIVDKFNEVGNNFAITSQGIGEALRLSASALNEGKNSLDESIAMITAANEVVNDPSSVGTALKTLTLRLRGSKTELEEMGEDVSDMATTTSQLQAKLLALTGGKVDIMLDENTFKNSTQILREMAEAWEDMDDISRASALELMGGKRQANVLSALIQNFDTVEEVIETSANSAGSALQENERYLDSIQGKIDQFNNATQAMWSNFLDSDWVKGIVEAGTWLIKLIDGVEIFGVKIGGLLPTLIALAAVIAKIKYKLTWSELFTSVGEGITKLNTNLTKLASRFGIVSTAATTANAALNNLTVGQFNHAMATAGVDEAHRKAMRSQMGLTGATNAQTIAQGALTAETLQEAVASGILNSEQAALLANKYGLTLATVELTSATAAQIMTEAGLDRAQKKRIISALGLTMQTKTLTREEFLNMLAANGIADADKRAAIAALFFKDANEKLSFSFKSLGKGIANFLKQNALLLAIAAAIAAIALVIKGVDALIKTSEELKEKLSESQSALEATTSELKDLRNELDEVNKAIQELQTQGTLSFTDQSELNRLRDQRRELESTIALKSKLETAQQKQVNSDAQDLYDSYKTTNFNNGKDEGEYMETGGKVGAGVGGTAGAIVMGTVLASAFAGTKLGAALGSWAGPVGIAIGAAAGAIIGGVVGIATGHATSQAGKDVEEQLDVMKSERDELEKKRDEAYRAYVADPENEKLLKKYEKAEEKLTEYDSKMAEHVAEIQQMRNQMDWSTATPSQRETIEEMDDFIDRYNIIMKSQGAVGNAIERILGYDRYDGVSEKIEELVEKYKETEDETILTQIAEEAKVAQADLADVSLSIQDVVDYYTLEKGLFDTSTIEGVTNQYLKGIKLMQELADNTKPIEIKIDNKIETFSFDDLFEQDESGKFKAREKEFSEMLKGMDEKAQNTFKKFAEHVKNGELTWSQAMEAMKHSANLAGYEFVGQQIADANAEIFNGIKDDINGTIDTFGEFKAALDDVATSMDLLHKAQEQMNTANRLSVQTALEIIESTDNWNDILDITNGTITLQEGATEALIQEKLNLVKANIENEIQQLEEQKSTILAQDASNDFATTIEESTNLAIRNMAGSMAYLTTMMEAYTRAANGEKINTEEFLEKAEAAKLEAIDGAEGELDWKKNSAEATGLETINKRLEDAYARLGLIDQVDTVDEFKDNYDFDKTPGDKYDDDSANDAFQREMDYWENRIAANQAKYEQLQNEIDLLEAKGQKADDSFYEEQIKLEGRRLELLNSQKDVAEAHLATLEEGSEEWWEVANTLNDIEGELDDVTASIVELQDAIAEIDTYKFEEFNTRLDNLTSKLETIRNLIAQDGEEDWFDEEGNWAEEGVAVLGSYLQELEMYKQGYAETVDELDKYTASYKGNEAYYESLGIHSEQEWYDKTEELISQQYDFAESISDTEQSVVDMYESSIDAVEEYTETLIDSYNDYIDSVKEALDAERDLYDFKKNVQKQAKDIATIERRIASLSGSTNAADIAERRKLEAQLYESRESLNDTYYDHAKNAQSEALDQEAEAYETSMNKMIEGLRTSLEEATSNMDEFLMGVTSMVMYNADTVLSKYEETNLPLTKELTNPWEEAKNAVGDYSGNALDLMNQWTKEGGFFAQFNANGTTNLTSPWNSGTTAANSFKTSVSTVMSGVVSNIATNVKTASGELSKLYQQIKDTEARAASANVTVSNTSTGTSSGSSYAAPKKYYVTAFLDMGSRSLSVTKSASSSSEAMSAAKIAIAGEYEKVKGNGIAAENAWLKTWRDRVKYTTKYYAKGTTNINKDQFAIVDELGPELILRANPETGRLDYMTAGTGVIPADLTENLMEWGQFTPEAMNLGGTINLNMINNAVNKPEFNFAFDALVKAENITEETLPAVKKLVTQELNRFTKELNYALKGKGAR